MDANLIIKVNKLHQLSSKFRGGPLLDLPQIVVVGDQSSGKSSLLQGFIGKDFLPSGSDKVTRRPIMLQLIHTDKNDTQKNGPLEYAVFPEENDKKYADFNQVKQKLTAAMNDVTKTEVVRDDTIIVQIYSPNVVTLTLFDLPGLVATNIKDEPAEAPELIRSLVERHIKDYNVIILAVVAGNTDVVTSTAVKLAEEVDPTGDRTVLAVTMLDLVKDEDAIDKTVNLLRGKTKPYKEGIVGVINQKQDAQSKRSVADRRLEEVTILQEKFQQLANQKGSVGTLKMGSEYLQQLLSKLLVRRITECLSDDMNRRIYQRMGECKVVLKMYGDDASDVDKIEALEDAIVSFSHLFSSAITGNAKDLRLIQSHIGNSNYKIFFVDFPKELQNMKHAPMFGDEHIQEYIMSALGPQPQLSAPFNAFQSMVREYINMTREPSVNAACNVKNGLSYTVEKCGGAMPGRIARFPILMSAIVQKTLEFLSKRLEQTLEMLETEINMEWEYINVNHPDFDRVCDEITSKAKRGAAATAMLTFDDKPYQSKRIPNMLTSDELKLAILAYIDIIYRNTLAMVPKVIYFSMINEVEDKLEGHLRSYFRNKNDDRLFDESRDIIEKRGEAEDGIRECEEARAVLAEMRQYSSRHEA